MTTDTHELEVRPLTPLRKIIAARMTEAKQSIPHFRVSADINMDKLLVLRKQCNDAHPAIKISVNDVIIKACAMTLIAHPEVNIQLIDKQIHQYRQADISVVMAVEGGLSTPVVRQADQKSVHTIAAEVKGLGERAKTGRLKMDEISGGSFSISNLGMYGIDQFDAIINPPQAAILAISSAKPQAIVHNNEIGIAIMLRASLSLDHRVLDGATGAQFLNALREQLEDPHALFSE